MTSPAESVDEDTRALLGMSHEWYGNFLLDRRKNTEVKDDDLLSHKHG